MRFLLNSRKHLLVRGTGGSKRKLDERIEPKRNVVDPMMNKQSMPSPTLPQHQLPPTNITSPFDSDSPQNVIIETCWGQQCSLKCGCVLRFETQLDASTQYIVSARYIAQTVVTQQVPGQGLVPIMTTMARTTTTTTTSPRPLLRPCTCQAVHELASHIVEALPGQTWNWLYNMMDFPGVRSSPALAHAVLSAHGLSPTHQHRHCFDLVEEACTAMVKRYLPRPRDNNNSSRDAYMEDTSLVVIGDDQSRLPLPPLPSSTATPPTPPRAMSTLRMYDIQAAGAPLSYRVYLQPNYGEPPPPQTYDWLDHVDHLEHAP